jgi:hypothetical protein
MYDGAGRSFDLLRELWNLLASDLFGVMPKLGTLENIHDTSSK